MRDFPVFPTDYGVSSLILNQIPYRQEAYIHILDVQPDGVYEHLKECVSFCRMAGAERIFATGHPCLDSYPYFMSVCEMRGTAWVDRQKLENLFPVTEQTVGYWRNLMNERMKSVDNAAFLTSFDEKKILSSGGAYFIHHEGELLGIGWMDDTKLLQVASVKGGAGEQVMYSLMSLVEGSDMTVEVASTNERAIRLYEKLGFIRTAELLRWHDVTALWKEATHDCCE